MAGPPSNRRDAGPSGRRGRGAARGFRGLPPLKEPVVEPGHRVMLMAYSKTGRASWADLAPLAKHDGGFRWVGNPPAVPDLAAARGRKGSGKAAGVSNVVEFLLGSRP